MKSKKKLIYKLHENLNENPFKQIQQTSYRNTGVKAYDFNKVKSIRAISLRGVGNDDNQKEISDWKKNHDLKMHMVNMRDEINQQAQQALICNKKRILVDQNLFKIQQKRINPKIGPKQIYNQQSRQRIDLSGRKNPQCSQQSPLLSPLTHQASTQQKSQQIHYMSSLSPSSRSKNVQGHSRHISLPLINKRQQQSVQSVNSVIYQNPKQQLDALVEEQKAKEHVLKQIRITAQEKINKQVLMSIKLKSIQNLERIARSQSQVIKIDKWKEKYGKSGADEFFGTKNGQKGLPIRILPQIDKEKDQTYNEIEEQQQFTPKYDSINNQLKQSTRYMRNITQDHLQGLQKSDIQLAKDSLYNVEANLDEDQQKSEEFLKHNPSILATLNRQYSMSIKQTPKFSSPYPMLLQQYYSTDNLQKEQQSLLDFSQSQPLKINITKLKKHDRKNKQNLNLQKEIEKNGKLEEEKGEKGGNDVTERSGMRIRKRTEDEEIERGRNHANEEKQKNQSLQAKNEPPSIPHQGPSQPDIQPPNLFSTQTLTRTKTRLYFSLAHKPKQSDSPQLAPIQPSPSIPLLKQKPARKYKINEEPQIFNRRFEEDRPMEWENKKHEDYEVEEFGNFVKNHVKSQEKELLG